MKTNRIVSVLAVLLSVGVVVLGTRVVQLRRQLSYAQVYVQSGLENWRFACGRVSSMLKMHANNPDAMDALQDIAHACISRTDIRTIDDSDSLSKDENNADPRGLILRIDRAIETGDYLIVEDHLTGDYPKGYHP